MLQSEGVRAKLTAQGWHMDDTSAQALARRMAQDARINGELIARKISVCNSARCAEDVPRDVGN